MSHITHNQVEVDHAHLNPEGKSYGIKQDSLGRVSYFILKQVSIGAHKGELVWSRVIERLVPNEVKEFLNA